MAHEQPLTADQFAALSELRHSRGGPAEQAAQLVLVEGLRPADAARQAGIEPQAVSNTLRSYQITLERARRAIRGN